jgi:hypothetical protein
MVSPSFLLVIVWGEGSLTKVNVKKGEKTHRYAGFGSN